MAEDEFRCSICFDATACAHVLPCGHQFCFICIHGWLGAAKGRKEKGCPECRQTVSSEPVAVVSIDKAVERLMQVRPPEELTDWKERQAKGKQVKREAEKAAAEAKARMAEENPQASGRAVPGWDAGLRAAADAARAALGLGQAGAGGKREQAL